MAQLPYNPAPLRQGWETKMFYGERNMIFVAITLCFDAYISKYSTKLQSQLCYIDSITSLFFCTQLELLAKISQTINRLIFGRYYPKPLRVHRHNIVPYISIRWVHFCTMSGMKQRVNGEIISRQLFSVTS